MDIAASTDVAIPTPPSHFFGENWSGTMEAIGVDCAGNGKLAKSQTRRLRRMRDLFCTALWFLLRLRRRRVSPALSHSVPANRGVAQMETPLPPLPSATTNLSKLAALLA